MTSSATTSVDAPRLLTLGGLALVLPAGEDDELARRRRKLALLTLLALSPRPLSRELLADYFWGDEDEERARHSLSDALSHFRRVLGRDVVAARGADVALTPGYLRVDAAEFVAACDRGETARAVALYGGPFLEGVFVDRAPRFDEWAAREREALRRRFARACEAECDALVRRGDHDACATLARRWLDATPESARAARVLVSARKAPGTPGALRDALATYDWLARRLRTEYGTEPDAELRALADEAAAQLGALAGAPAVSMAQRASPDAPLDVARSGVSVAAPPAAPPAPSAPAPEAPPSPQLATRVRRPWRRPSPRVVATAVALLSVLALGLVRVTARHPHPRPWVVVADAESGARDPAFDGALPLALAVAIAQSPDVDVLPSARVRAILQTMRRADSAGALDEATAREVAARAGATTVLVPAVVRLGDAYLLSARVVDAATGSTAAVERVRAERRAALLDALDALARRVRRRLGDSYLAAREGVPLPLATTASLPALEAYADGVRAYDQRRFDDAGAYFESALAHDSTFALVHAALGAFYYLTNRPPEGERAFAAALRHAARLPERERLLVEARAAGWRGDRARAIALRERWLAAHPLDREVLGGLAYDYVRAHRAADARDAYRRLMALDSLDAMDHVNLATAYKELRGRDDLARAIAEYHRAFALQPDLRTSFNLNHQFGAIFVLAGQPDSAAAVFREMLARDPASQARGHRSLAYLALHEGRYARAAGELRESVLLDAAGGYALSEARDRVLLAEVLDAVGQGAAARAQRDSVLAIVRRAYLEPTMLLWLGKPLARRGELRAAREVLDTLRARAKPTNPPHRSALRLLEGEVALAEGRLTDAVRAAAEGVALDSTAYTVESLAHAAWRAGDLSRAAALYAALGAGADFGWEGTEAWRAAPYWLGQVEEARGDRAAARRAFAAYLARLAVPDPELIAVADARSRLAALGGAPRGGQASR